MNRGILKPLVSRVGAAKVCTYPLTWIFNISQLGCGFSVAGAVICAKKSLPLVLGPTKTHHLSDMVYLMDQGVVLVYLMGQGVLVRSKWVMSIYSKALPRVVSHEEVRPFQGWSRI